ncbi:MAG: (d)CMP kinase [Planctomycetaceae bacterium]|nr:(d)CMP kinase [Planctomycetaceae bacterium]
MIVTIDGPAGAGKSTIAKMLASELGFDYLDTGAMYRAVALAGLRNGVHWEKPDELASLAERLPIRVQSGRTFLGEEDVSKAVRTENVTEKTRFSANNPAIRVLMARRQQELARGKNIVTEGRDQGTAVFPDAECKIYLTATPEERAKRRVLEYQKQGETAAYDEILQKINQRDRSDMNREIGPLCEPIDAIHVETDNLSINDVVKRLVEIVNERAAKNAF